MKALSGLPEDKSRDNRMINDAENFDPNAFSIEVEPLSVKKAKLKDRRSLMKRQGSSRRRRRSSARFLKIVPGDDEDGDGEGLEYDGTSTTNLGEVYRNAIRMNAENRINASNSWNLNLIDHLDRFVVPEPRHGTGGGNSGRHWRNTEGENTPRTDNSNAMESSLDSTMVAGVNFTKASCTLDASVKIYSYRVDDVHLTSYKVLANLNRTDSSTNDNHNVMKKKSTSEYTSDHSVDDHGEDSGSRTIKSRGISNSVDTLEANTANINMHKLDAAFDIDPLFHKMSKTFDEGGAKGLLLANLGVGSTGCNIVFDSSLDDDDATTIPHSEDLKIDGFETSGVLVQQNIEGVFPAVNETTDSNFGVDVTSLISKLESLLSSALGNQNTIESMPLVPQLASLRNQYTELGKEGFVEDVGKSSKRYASSVQDEAEADKSIHLEAIERSRVSQADLGRSRDHRDSVTTYGSDDDYINGENGFHYGGDDDDIFGELYDGDHRFSSSSFAPARASFSMLEKEENKSSTNEIDISNDAEPRESSRKANSQASVLLDAIASGEISTLQQNHYDYFNSQALKNFSSGNWWAGAKHWKKLPSGRWRKQGADANNRSHGNKWNIVKHESAMPPKKKKGLKTKTKSTSASYVPSFVSISKPVENLDALLQKPKRKRGKNVTDPLQLTKAMRTKCSNADNLLPVDAGLEVKEFVTLFSRPNTSLIDLVEMKKNVDKSAKVVAFGGVDTWDCDDASGVGLDFGSNEDDENNLNEFVIPDLEDVRKVDKINIGYATVARKVDVKRLKRDLWTELEQTFSSRNEDSFENMPKEKDSSDSLIAPRFSDESRRLSDTNDDINVTTLSFQDTVRDMQNSQSQSDVTVPFYFICILHLCNEKGLALESSGLDDFVIHSS